VIALSLPARVHPRAPHAIRAVAPRLGVQQAGVVAVAGEQLEVSFLGHENNDRHAVPIRHREPGRSVFTSVLRGAK
jgi:type II secretory pathway component PulK